MTAAVEVADHVETLRIQARFTVRVLRSTGQLLDRFLNGQRIDSNEIDQLRSQVRAAMRALRMTNQLLAQAAQLIDEADQPQEAHHGHTRTSTARLG